MAKIVSFSLDRESLGLIQKIESERNFKNRSELIRAALQQLLQETREIRTDGGHIDGVIVVTHRERGEDGISTLVHRYADVITTHVHNNLHELCVETFIVHGNAKTIRQFVGEMRENKEALSTKITIVSE